MNKGKPDLLGSSLDSHCLSNEQGEAAYVKAILEEGMLYTGDVKDLEKSIK